MNNKNTKATEAVGLLFSALPLHRTGKNTWNNTTKHATDIRHYFTHFPTYDKMVEV